jgi:hypothetical protein
MFVSSMRKRTHHMIHIRWFREFQGIVLGSPFLSVLRITLVERIDPIQSAWLSSVPGYPDVHIDKGNTETEGIVGCKFQPRSTRERGDSRDGERYGRPTASYILSSVMAHVDSP